MIETKLSPGEQPKKIFEKISKIENELNNSTRCLDIEALTEIVTSAKTATNMPKVVTEMRLRGNDAKIAKSKSSDYLGL